MQASPAGSMENAMHSTLLGVFAEIVLAGLSFGAHAIPCSDVAWQGVTCIATPGFTRGDSLAPYSTEDVTFSAAVVNDEHYSIYLAEFTSPQTLVAGSVETVQIVSTPELQYLRPVYLSPQPRFVVELHNPDGSYLSPTASSGSFEVYGASSNVPFGNVAIFLGEG